MNFRRNKKETQNNSAERASDSKDAPPSTGFEGQTETVPEQEPETELTPEALEQLKAKASECDEWKSRCLYTAAELENFRKRAAKERKEMLDYAGQNILFDLLDIIDNFERALEADKNENDPTVIIDGIEIIFSQLTKLLDKYGVARVPSKGEAFNPEVHEAIQQIPVPGSKPGTVVEELQKGYTFRNRTLRPARVVVTAEHNE